MTNRGERSQDIVYNCDLLLEELSGQPKTDSTPEGRMISQLKWLREKVSEGGAQLPVDPVYLSTLRHVYTEGSLSRLADNQDDYLKIWAVPMKRLIKLAYKGEYLLKKPFYPSVDRCISKLIHIIRRSDRALKPEEDSCISELEDMRDKLLNNDLEPPIMDWLDYPSFRKVYSIVGSTVDDLPKGAETCTLVAELMFEGVRPESWITPKAADLETEGYV